MLAAGFEVDVIDRMVLNLVMGRRRPEARKIDAIAACACSNQRYSNVNVYSLRHSSAEATRIPVGVAFLKRPFR